MSDDMVTWTLEFARGDIQKSLENFIEIKSDKTLDLVGGWDRDSPSNDVNLTTGYVVYRADGSTHDFQLQDRAGATTFGNRVNVVVVRRLDHTLNACTVVGQVRIHDA